MVLLCLRSKMLKHLKNGDTYILKNMSCLEIITYATLTRTRDREKRIDKRRGQRKVEERCQTFQTLMQDELTCWHIGQALDEAISPSPHLWHTQRCPHGMKMCVLLPCMHTQHSRAICSAAALSVPPAAAHAGPRPAPPLAPERPR